MLSFVTACTPDDNIPGTPDLPGETTSYEIKGDMQLPMNMFIGNIPEEYAAFKEPLAAMSTMRENALKQVLSTDDVQIGFRKITYLYPSTSVSGEPLTLSAVAFWLGYFSNGVWNDLKPENICLMEHYTITSDAETPSNTFSLEMFITGNTLTIMPDYLGYGITANHVHPYLVMDITSRNVVDMYRAVVPFMQAAGCAPEHDDIYLLGYSQGGAVTMAVQHYIEHHNEDNIKIRRVFAGGGPYDVKATYDRFVETNHANYPCAVPIMMQGMVVGNKLDLDMKDLMADYIYENLDEWVNSKRYTSGQINGFLGTHVTSELLKPKGMDRTSKEVSELYKAMTNNSILSYAWTPQAPVFLMHSIDDDVVPYDNAIKAKHKWKDSNVQYSFGHYGSHTATCLRFLYAVQKLLINEEAEENGHYDF